MVTFHANGGLKTQPGSIFAQQGLNLNLVPGDNYVQQVRDYLAGKTPFLRGTFRMIGMASEVIGADPRTKGVVFMQLTWSAGDHCVGREGIRTIADIRGKKIVLQKGGPHVGMLDDILKTANVSWDDITVVWADDLTASDNSPAEMFRKDDSIAACFVISPDMIGLSGGFANIGSGAEGTVRGAHVVVSTSELSYSIADVYVCRKDFYDAHQDLVEKFTAGYLKGCETTMALRQQYEATGSRDYMQFLQLTQDIYSKEVIPTLEEDAHGLFIDCTLVGHPGNVEFFTDDNNLHGFKVFEDKSLELATSRGYAGIRQGLFPSTLNWNAPGFMDYLTKTKAVTGPRFKAEAAISEVEALGAGLSEKDLISPFTIAFNFEQDTFPASAYATEYQRVIESIGMFGNAVIAIRGHADTFLALRTLLQAGMAKGVLKQTGTAGNYVYYLDGKVLDLSNTAALVQAIEAGKFDGHPEFNPREVVQSTLNLSKRRAEAVKSSIIEFAKGRGISIDTSQIQAVGVGIKEPIVALPRAESDQKANMRVEFRMIRVAAEAKITSGGVIW